MTSDIKIGIYGRALENRTGMGRYANRVVGGLLDHQEQEKYALFLRGNSPLLADDLYRQVAVPLSKVSQRVIEEQLVLPWRLRTSQLDVFHNLDLTLPFALPRKIKAIVTVYDVAYLRFPSSSGKKSRLLYATFAPRSVARADAIVTISEFSKREIADAYGIDPAKIYVIACGVESRFKPAAPAEVERVRQALGIPDGPIILYIGAIEERKNLVRLAEAIAGISSPDVKFVISGVENRRGSEMSEDIRRILEGRVHFTGYVPDELLPGLYCAADLFVFPSFYEGFGLPPIEAMACGVPVAVADAASLPEVVGDAGEYFDPMDVASIRATLQKVLDDDGLRARMAVSGIERSKRFKWQDAVNRTRTLYHKLCETTRSD